MIWGWIFNSACDHALHCIYHDHVHDFGFDFHGNVYVSLEYVCVLNAHAYDLYSCHHACVLWYHYDYVHDDESNYGFHEV